MAAAARHRDLEIRLPEDGIEGADREGQRGGRRIPAGGAIELLRPPYRIAQQVERLPRENRRNLVVPMPVGGRPGEDCDDDLRPEPPDDVDHVFEDRVAGPEAERLLDRLGKAEIVRGDRSEEHTSELQSHSDLVCRLLLEKKKKTSIYLNCRYWT